MSYRAVSPTYQLTNTHMHIKTNVLLTMFNVQNRPAINKMYQSRYNETSNLFTHIHTHKLILLSD